MSATALPREIFPAQQSGNSETPWYLSPQKKPDTGVFHVTSVSKKLERLGVFAHGRRHPARSRKSDADFPDTGVAGSDSATKETERDSMTMDDDAPSLTELHERMIHDSAGLSDFALDDRLAEAKAHRDVAAVHHREVTAAVWNNVAIALDDIRTARVDVAREVEDLTGPPPPPDEGELELPGG